MKIKAAVTAQKGSPFEIREVELAPPQKHEILVKITACGVCHTDDAARHRLSLYRCPQYWGMKAAALSKQSDPKSPNFRWATRSVSHLAFAVIVTTV